MAVTLINATGAQWGVADDETAANIEEFKSSWEPQFIEPFMTKQNERRGAAIASSKVTVDMSGETLGVVSGIVSTNFITKFTPQNDYGYFGGGTPDLLVTKGDVTQNRSSWMKFSASLEGFETQTV